MDKQLEKQLDDLIAMRQANKTLSYRMAWNGIYQKSTGYQLFKLT